MVKHNRFAGLMDARAGATAVVEGDRDDQRGGRAQPWSAARRQAEQPPDYKQISALVRKDTHRNVMRALLDEPTDRDVSDLLQALLEDWLSGREGAGRTQSRGA